MSVIEGSTVSIFIIEDNMQYLDEKIEELTHECVQRLKKQGFQR